MALSHPVHEKQKWLVDHQLFTARWENEREEMKSDLTIGGLTLNLVGLNLLGPL